MVYEDTDSINISARSLGNINVQVILKNWGGGNTSMAELRLPGNPWRCSEGTLFGH